MSELAPAIRYAAPGDGAAIAALGARVFADTYGAAIPGPTLRAYLGRAFVAERFAAPAQPLLVATLGAELLGYARLDSPAPPPGAPPAALELAQLYVDRPYHGRGVGARLLRAAGAAAGGPLWLCAWEQNRRALGFYARHGFAPAGRMDVYVDTVVFRDIVLVRPAAPPMEAAP